MKKALVITGAVAASAAAAWLLVGSHGHDHATEAPKVVEAPHPAQAPALKGCSFAAGDHEAFALASTAKAITTQAGVPTDSFKAVLSWEAVSEAPPGTWLLRVGLTSIALEQNLSRPEQRVSEPLDGVFMIKMDRQCRFTGKGFARTSKPVTRRFLSDIVSTYEVALPEAAASSWDLDQTDGLGRYAARYTGLGRDDGTVDLTKRKTLYRSDQRPGALDIRVQVVDAHANARLDAAGHWLESEDGVERIRISMHAQVLADLEQTFALTRSDDRFVRPDPSVDEASLDWAPPAAASASDTDSVDPALKGVSLPDALARFVTAYGNSAQGDAYAAARELAAWLRARPEQAAVLLEALKHHQVADKMRPAAFLALERCGTPEARAVLTRAVADRQLGDMDRARAASALSDVPQPTTESARALKEQSAVSAGSQLVAGTSVRALGHLASRGDALPAGVQGDLHQSLEQDLATAKGSTRTVDVIDALGNTGDKSFVPSLTEKLADDSPAIREHAARAMAGMPLADTEPVLLQSLRSDQEADVRGAAVSSLAAAGDHDPQALAQGAQALATEPSPAVRASLIRWLGSAGDAGGAKDALVAQFHRETVPALMQLIGQYVSASDLK